VSGDEIEAAKAGTGGTYHSKASFLGHSPLRSRQLAAEGAALFRPTLADTGSAERSHQTACSGRYAARVGAQLQRQPRDDFEAYGLSVPPGK